MSMADSVCHAPPVSMTLETFILTLTSDFFKQIILLKLFNSVLPEVQKGQCLLSLDALVPFCTQFGTTYYQHIEQQRELDGARVFEHSDNICLLFKGRFL